MTDPRLAARIVHADRRYGAEHGALHKPIHTSVQYGFARTEDLIAVFQGRAKDAYNYARQGTPTTAALESLLTQLEGGRGTICFATGMAAIAAVFFTLLRAGDHIVASQHVFGSTNSIFGTLRDFGVEVSTIDATDAANARAAWQPNTRLVFVETIANPGTQVADLAALGALCRERGALYVVDNTVTSPALFTPRDVGAGLVVQSLSKTVGGHGIALGGAVTDTGLFDWRGWHQITPAYRSGDPTGWGLAQIRKKGLRDLGATLSSDAAQRIAVGAETLPLRVERTSRTAQALAEFLQQHPAVARVHYPGLASHPQHALAARLFKAPSWLLSFELHRADAMSAVLDALRLPILATGMGDTRTLIIPVAPTIFWEAGPEVRQRMGIADGLVRVSVGLEDADELIEDFTLALQAAG